MPRKYRVIFRAGAREDAVEAAAYIADQGYPATAARWFKRLERAIASLSSMPRRCPAAREQERVPGVELRQLVFESHRVIFTIRGWEVHVLHVRHAARRTLGESGDEA